MLPEAKVDVGGCGTGDATNERIKTLTDRCRLGHEARGLRHGEWAGAPSAPRVEPAHVSMDAGR